MTTTTSETTTTTKWNLDKTHAEVQFKIRHLMISNVSGTFTNFNAEAVTNENDFTTLKASFTADVNSLTTANEQRDGHLKAEDFFNVAKYPTITFVSTRIENVTKENFTMFGNFTMKGLTKEIQLNVDFGGITKDAWGNTKAGFEVTGKINRSDYGLTWNMLTETGGVTLSDEVKIYCNVEFAKV